MDLRSKQNTLISNLLTSVQKYPEHLAFKCGKDEISYAELDNITNQIAAVLQNKNTKRGDRVGIYLNRCIETAIAIYGILKAGAVYVPLNPRAPKDRTLSIIKDANISSLISNNHQNRDLSQWADEAKIQLIIGSDVDINGESVSWENLKSKTASSFDSIDPTQDDLAYILFTSGSTGIPKGIMHTHGSGAAYARLTAKTYGITHDDIIGNHAPIYFDISTLGYFTGPAVGATTIISTDGEVIIARQLAAMIERENITLWYSVPLAIMQMMDIPDVTIDFSSLRWMLYAGEAFPTSRLRTWMIDHPGIPVSNIYGPTETNQCTNHNLTSPPKTDDPIPIGTTWDETIHIVLDGDDNPVSRGIMGQLCISSSTNMRGYWNNQELTDRSFYYADADPTTVYYKTGDLVIEDAQGILHFKGRIDNQVKVRGYRIELNEIEVAIATHIAVDECICKIFGEVEDKYIATFVTLFADKTLDYAQLKQHLLQKLPSYALPSKMHILDTFPRTATGKIDRNKLNEK